MQRQQRNLKYQILLEQQKKQEPEKRSDIYNLHQHKFQHSRKGQQSFCKNTALHIFTIFCKV
ncbi:hypothetical protein OIU74_006534 [Salix koriyanagi]|uniref:Uncharacterized protein n=1 Tax=Salix koriyanagi TaxID=2511006 RepID=A0A9Q0UEH8_9ROSI|nr:hypothetical protein OIU74_006534 [Salix koriyanagi]